MALKVSQKMGFIGSIEMRVWQPLSHINGKTGALEREEEREAAEREKKRERRGRKEKKKSRKFLEPGLSVQPYFRSNSDHDSSHLGILLISSHSPKSIEKILFRNLWNQSLEVHRIQPQTRCSRNS